MHLKFNFFLTFIFVSGFLFASNPNESEINLLKKMFSKIDKMKSIEYYGTVNNRIEGNLQKTLGTFKINKQPFKFYYKQESPKKGQEVIYIEGKNNNKALVNTNSFPWMSVSLLPNSKLMRQNNHHSIFNAGFWYFNNVLKEMVFSDKCTVTAKGSVVYNGKDCIELELKHKNFELKHYTIKNGESIVSIAKERNINDFMIVELNKEIKNVNDFKVGQKIIIPNGYADKLTLLIDKETMLPVNVKVYDLEGLYEELSFDKVKFDHNVNISL